VNVQNELNDSAEPNVALKSFFEVLGAPAGGVLWRCRHHRPNMAFGGTFRFAFLLLYANSGYMCNPQKLVGAISCLISVVCTGTQSCHIGARRLHVVRCFVDPTGKRNEAGVRHHSISAAVPMSVANACVFARNWLRASPVLLRNTFVHGKRSRTYVWPIKTMSMRRTHPNRRVIQTG
jgi:hypothetical protein